MRALGPVAALLALGVAAWWFGPDPGPVTFVLRTEGPPREIEIRLD